MKLLIYFNKFATLILTISIVATFVYLFNSIVVVNETKKITKNIEEVTSKISELTSAYYSIDSKVEIMKTESQDFATPVSSSYISLTDSPLGQTAVAR